ERSGDVRRGLVVGGGEPRGDGGVRGDDCVRRVDWHPGGRSGRVVGGYVDGGRVVAGPVGVRCAGEFHGDGDFGEPVAGDPGGCGAVQGGRGRPRCSGGARRERSGDVRRGLVVGGGEPRGDGGVLRRLRVRRVDRHVGGWSGRVVGGYVDGGRVVAGPVGVRCAGEFH